MKCFMWMSLLYMEPYRFVCTNNWTLSKCSYWQDPLTSGFWGIDNHLICHPRTLIFGRTDPYLTWWSGQLQTMYVSFFTSITRWWKNWMNDRYGILLFVVHCIADVSASMIMIMLIGHLSLPFQVFMFWLWIVYQRWTVNTCKSGCTVYTSVVY